MLLRARWVLPVTSPPIEDGAVVVENDRITYVGAYGRAPMHARTGRCVDLADQSLLPGLVNAHGHLEHSALKGLTTSRLPFTEWIKEVAREKAALSKGDIRSGVLRGIDSLIRGGTTTLADHAHPEMDFGAIHESPLRRIVFWEVLGAHKGRAEECLEMARRRASQ
jgi:5-methylthioadenosine/S-adenosylhomocysteine deaminase